MIQRWRSAEALEPEIGTARTEISGRPNDGVAAAGGTTIGINKSKQQESRRSERSRRQGRERQAELKTMQPTGGVLQVFAINAKNDGNGGSRGQSPMTTKTKAQKEMCMMIGMVGAKDKAQRPKHCNNSAQDDRKGEGRGQSPMKANDQNVHAYNSTESNAQNRCDESTKHKEARGNPNECQ